MVSEIESNLNNILMTKLDDLSKESIEYMEKVEKAKKESQNRFESFWGRKKWIDMLVIFNLALTPIILILISYWIFFKK